MTTNQTYTINFDYYTLDGVFVHKTTLPFESESWESALYSAVKVATKMFITKEDTQQYQLRIYTDCHPDNVVNVKHK